MLPLEKKITFKINDLSTELEKLEKGIADKPQKSRRKEIINIEAEINEVKSNHMIETIDQDKYFLNSLMKLTNFC